MSQTIFVKDLMSKEVVTLQDGEDLELAHSIMNLARIRHLPVVDAHDKLVGLVTHRDILRAQASLFAALSPSEDREMKRSIKVRQIMTAEVKTIGPEASALDAARLMFQLKLGCLPVVVEDNHLIGILTEADFVALVIQVLETQAGRAKKKR